MFKLMTLGASAIFVIVVYTRLIRLLNIRKTAKILLLLLTMLFAVSIRGSLIISRAIAQDSPWHWLVWVAYGVVTFCALLFVIILIRDILWLGVLLISKVKNRLSRRGIPTPGDAPSSVEAHLRHQSRRNFLLATSSIAIGGIALVATPAAIYSAKACRKIRHVTITFDDLPHDLDGLRIAHLADIHVGNTITKNDIANIVRETNAQSPDLVAITGDIADGLPEIIGDDLSPMRDFQTKYGTYYVTGNHEHIWNAPGWCDVIAKLGIHVLNNESRIVQVGGSRLAVAGATDPRGVRDNMPSDPAAALAGIPEDAFRLMLVHQPMSVDISLEHGADLVLVGHTHGGQFWPVNFIVDAIHKYSRGLYRIGQQAVFVSCGTGYWGPPIRLGVPPEICILKLKRA